MKCSLCQSDKKLIDAHIIPAWAYEYIYQKIDKEKREALLMIGAKLHTKRRPIGSYDPNILCQSCDKLIGDRYDQLGKKFFIDEEISDDPPIQKIRKPNIDTFETFYFISNLESRDQ
jgi:hypothetical protein